MKPKLEREIVFAPAYDKRSPIPSQNYGIGSVDMRWYVKGPKGIIQFCLSTGWLLPEVAREPGRTAIKPLAYDLGYHSPKPLYKGQELLEENCEMLGGPCYYDGSSLMADEAFAILAREGGESLWRYLEGQYEARFGCKRRAA